MKKRVPRWSKQAYAYLVEDSRLGPFVEEIGPPKIRVFSDKFPPLLMAIVGQQLSGRAAETIWNRIVDRTEITPEAVGSLAHDDLRACGLSNAKARSMLEICDAIDQGFDLDALKDHEDEDVIERLVTLRGVGRWTAEMFMMFTLGRPDVMSAGDLGLRKGLQIVYRKRKMPEQKQCEKLYRPWKPWRTAASWYLWKVVEGREMDSW